MTHLVAMFSDLLVAAEAFLCADIARVGALKVPGALLDFLPSGVARRSGVSRLKASRCRMSAWLETASVARLRNAVAVLTGGVYIWGLGHRVGQRLPIPLLPRKSTWIHPTK